MLVWWSVQQLKTKECHMWQPYVFPAGITCISVGNQGPVYIITIKKPF